MHCKKIQQVSWQNVREDFAKVNSKLANVIDAISPGDDLPLIKVTYTFGDKILNNGKLCILEDFKNNPSLAQILGLPNIVENLSYAPVPLGLFLNKACETFITTNDRIVPLFVLRPGFTIGLYETVDLICGAKSTPLWNVTAGARSTFMLAKINNNLWHKRLQRHFNISLPAPTALQEHWDIFTAIANSSVVNSDWSCDVLFFTKSWTQHLNDNSAGWLGLREYIFRECWLHSSPAIGKNFSFIWHQFSVSTINRHYKPRIYITDTIRHLMSIASRLAPAFAPTINEESLPMQVIKTAYHDIYDLPYTPTIMEPVSLSDNTPLVYYSLGYPTLLEGHPEKANIYNTISDLKEIKQLIENMYCYYQQHIESMQKFSQIVQQVDLAYFHKAVSNESSIYEAAQVTEVDQNFHETIPAFAKKKFCSTAPFLNGCIQLKNKSSAINA